MRRATLTLYVLLGIAAVAGGVVAVVAPHVALPPDRSTGLPAHLIQEQGAGFVFIGLMFFWCARHYDRRRPVHLSLVVFTALFAAVHWQGYLRDGGGLRYAMANMVPVVLLGLTAPWSRARD